MAQYWLTEPIKGNALADSTAPLAPGSLAEIPQCWRLVSLWGMWSFSRFPCTPIQFAIMSYISKYVVKMCKADAQSETRSPYTALMRPDPSDSLVVCGNLARLLDGEARLGSVFVTAPEALVRNETISVAGARDDELDLWDVIERTEAIGNRSEITPEVVRRTVRGMLQREPFTPTYFLPEWADMFGAEILYHHVALMLVRDVMAALVEAECSSTRMLDWWYDRAVATKTVSVFNDFCSDFCSGARNNLHPFEGITGYLVSQHGRPEIASDLLMLSALLLASGLAGSAATAMTSLFTCLPVEGGTRRLACALSVDPNLQDIAVAAMTRSVLMAVDPDGKDADARERLRGFISDETMESMVGTWNSETCAQIVHTQHKMRAYTMSAFLGYRMRLGWSENLVALMVGDRELARSIECQMQASTPSNNRDLLQRIVPDSVIDGPLSGSYFTEVSG